MALKLRFALLFFLLAFVSTMAIADDTPDWLKRVELSIQYETDQTPVFYFQTVQPLRSGIDDVWFYQPRVSLSGGNFTYNLGIGYRRLVNDDLLLGANLFGDYEDYHEHGRIGLGFEALTQVLEARLNTYFRLTDTRKVSETDSTTVYERVANGADFELGSPVPYLPWLKIYASGFWYNFSRFSDKKGWKVRAEAKLSDFILFEFYTWDDNKGEQEYGGRLRFFMKFDALSDFKDVFKRLQEPFPKKDLHKQMLVPVERNYDIVVEKWSESASLTVEIARGN